jgi:hypothetical protein
MMTWMGSTGRRIGISMLSRVEMDELTDPGTSDVAAKDIDE